MRKRREWKTLRRKGRVFTKVDQESRLKSHGIRMFASPSVTLLVFHPILLLLSMLVSFISVLKSVTPSLIRATETEDETHQEKNRD